MNSKKINEALDNFYNTVDDKETKTNLDEVIDINQLKAARGRETTSIQNDEENKRKKFRSNVRYVYRKLKPIYDSYLEIGKYLEDEEIISPGYHFVDNPDYLIFENGVSHNFGIIRRGDYAFNAYGVEGGGYCGNVGLVFLKNKVLLVDDNLLVVPRYNNDISQVHGSDLDNYLSMSEDAADPKYNNVDRFIERIENIVNKYIEKFPELEDIAESVKVDKKKTLKENTWRTQLKSGVELRKLLNSDESEDDSIEFYQKVLDQLRKCCEEAIEICKDKGVDEYETNGFQSVIDDIDMCYDDEELGESDVDWLLDGFWDWCDAAKIWVPLSESEDKMLKENGDVKGFSGIEFEKELNHNMRWKEYDTFEDPKTHEKTLYWVTQEPFSKNDFEVFIDAFRYTGFDKAYVTVRDFSSYDFNDDLEAKVFAYVDKQGNRNFTDYWEKVKEAGWEDELTEADISIDSSITKTYNPENILNYLKETIGNIGKYDINNISLWMTSKGNVEVREKDSNTSIVKLDRSNFTDEDIDYLKENGYFDDFMKSEEDPLIESTEVNLPEFCYSSLPSDDRKVIKIVKGEDGYHPLDVEFETKEEAQEYISKMNDELGVTPAMKRAMMVGSMFGWDAPGANPNHPINQRNLGESLNWKNHKLLKESAENVQAFWEKGFKPGDKIMTDVGESEIIDLNKDADYVLVKLPTEYVAAWAPGIYGDKIAWGQGHYFPTEDGAKEYFNSLNESEQNSSNTNVYVVCYDSMDVFPDKEAAIDFYSFGYSMSEGSEKERYINVLWDLLHMEGKEYAYDGVSDQINDIKYRNKDGDTIKKQELDKSMDIKSALDYARNLKESINLEDDKPSSGFKRTIVIKDSINDEKFRFIKEYNGFGIYQEVVPSGYLVSQSYLITNGKDKPLISYSFCHNDEEDMLDIIDTYNETGNYGQKIMDKGDYLIIHNGGTFVESCKKGKKKKALKENDNYQISEEEFLNSTIPVYDLDEFVDYLNEKNGTNYEAHSFNERALIRDIDGRYILSTYEAVRWIYNAVTDTVEVDVHEKPKEEEDGTFTISIIPTAYARVPLKSILDVCKPKEMKASEFFSKRNYNPRCESNFAGLMDDINCVGETTHKMIDVNMDKPENTDEELTEAEVPASQLDFKHQQLAKVQSDIEVIAGLKAEDTSNDLYTELLDAYDKIVKVLSDAIAEDPIGTIVGSNEESVGLDIETEEPIEEPIEEEPAEEKPEEPAEEKPEEPAEEKPEEEENNE